MSTMPHYIVGKRFGQKLFFLKWELIKFFLPMKKWQLLLEMTTTFISKVNCTKGSNQLQEDCARMNKYTELVITVPWNYYYSRSLCENDTINWCMHVRTLLVFFIYLYNTIHQVALNKNILTNNHLLHYVVQNVLQMLLKM